MPLQGRIEPPSRFSNEHFPPLTPQDFPSPFPPSPNWTVYRSPPMFPVQVKSSPHQEVQEEKTSTIETLIAPGEMILHLLTPPRSLLPSALPVYSFEELNGHWTPVPVSTHCHLCDVDTKSLEGHYQHLSTNMHQLNSFKATKDRFSNNQLQLPTFLLWDQEKNQRSMVVTDCTKAKTMKALLFHFVKYGYVTDYIADYRGAFAIVQYHEKSCIKRMLEDKGHKINGGFVRVRCKSMISFVEWSILLNLDGVGDNVDQQFFINHYELMISLRNLPIHIQLLRFFEKIGIRVKMLELRKKVFGEMYDLFSKLFPHMICGLCLPQAKELLEMDNVLDVFLDPLGESSIISPNFHRSIPYQAAINKAWIMLSNLDHKYEMDKIVNQIAMSPEEMFFNYEEEIDFLTFTHLSSGMKCRLFFDDPFAPLIGSLIDLLVEMDPIAGQLFRFLTYWARTCRLSQKEATMNTLLSMMLFTFLMKKNFFPSIKELQELQEPDKPKEFLQGCKVSICRDIPTIEEHMMMKGKLAYYHENPIPHSTHQFHYEEMLGRIRQTRMAFTILRDFFQDFAWMDYDDSIISPNVGTTLSKAEYIRKYIPEGCDCKNGVDNPPITSRAWDMTIQHPFDISRNMACNVDKSLVSEMQKQFKNAAERITEELAAKDPQIGNMFSAFQNIVKCEPSCRWNAVDGMRRDVTQVFIPDSDSETDAESEESSGY